MINCVIIGAGIIAGAHMGGYKKLDNVKVVAAVDIDIEGAKERFKDEFPIYGTLDEALANHKVDMVDVCTPTDTHVRISIEALEKGLHVLCEKPMSKTPEEAALLTAAAKISDKLFMIAHVVRFMQPYLYLKEVVKSGELGKPVKLEFTRASGLPQKRLNNWILNPEISGGTVIDMNIHDLDFVKDVFGRPEKIQGVCHKMTNITDDDWVSASLIYDGFAITVQGGWFSYPIAFSDEYNAIFEKGHIKSAGGKIIRNGEEVDMSAFSVKTNSGLEVNGADGYADEIAYFVSCIEKGIAPEMVTPESSEDSVRLANEVIANSVIL